ncbi:MAG: adenine deaminase [Treponema sp.]|jgi:adenine deaminase|nr:adenine deaminase [Treponema sp.]
MDKNTLQRLIAVAAGKMPADLVIRGGLIANVYTGRFVPGDLVVAEGLVATIGEPGSYEGMEIVDAGGQYVLPAFIDGHMHIESTFLAPPELARLLVPRGTVTIVADPHEAANIRGLAGIDYMLAASEGIVLDIKFMAPSCVPCTPYEHNGATLDAAALAGPLAHERVLGLGEMMDYEGVINGKSEVLDKIVLALNRGKFVDGHSPGLRGRGLSAYMAGMIHTDHECSTLEEMNRRLEMGMYVMLRQGSACHDLRKLIPGVNAANSRRCVLCADDLQPHTIFEEGHIDNDLRICVEEGLDPMTALRMATLNAAECFGLRDRGGFAPGLRADAALVHDLRDFHVGKVFVKGRLAAEDGRMLAPEPPRTDDAPLRASFHVKDFSAKKLAMALTSDEVWVIDVSPGSVVTGKGRAVIRRDGSGNLVFDPAPGVAKIAVVERHQNTGNVGLGLIRGYGIRRGAVAISMSHDSHNIIVVGVNDADMALAVERLIALGGGAILVMDGAVLEEMPLPLAGIMSDQNGEWVDRKLESLEQKAVEELGVNTGVEPLMTLCFMSLPVIPDLKITDMGLFDTAAFTFIPVEAK